MYKVFTITIGSYLMKVGVCGENDTLPKSAGLVSVIFQVYDLDEAQSLARRLVNSMGNIHNHEVYMASDNGQILYVGMGKHGRHKHLTSGFSHVKEANEYSGDIQVEVVQRGLSRRQAAKYEAEMIAELSPSWNRVQPKVVDDDGDDLETTVEGFDIVEPKKDYRKVKESTSGLTKSVVKELTIEEMAKELCEARPSLPSSVYHNFTARKSFEKESGVSINVDEKFVAERNRDAMENILNISEDFLDNVDNCKTAVKENWMNKAIAYKTLTDSHKELFALLMELGNGSLKSGDFAKQSIELLREYCWIEKGAFEEIPMSKRMEIRRIVSGNYLTSFGYEFGIRAGKENINDFDKASGKVIRRFLGNLGMIVETKRKMISGEAGEYSVLATRDYIIDKTLSDDSVMDSDTTEQVKLAREIIQQMKIDE